MNRKSQMVLLAAGCLAGLAVAEQTGLIRCCFSNYVSSTGVDVVRKPSAGDLVSTTEVTRPVTRWLPLVKFGETVHRYTYQDLTKSGTVYEHQETTRTKLWVVGFCSTASYDELADQSFEKARLKGSGRTAAR
jgi:hypothetical protein